MNFTIKGRFAKVNGSWEAAIPILRIKVEDTNALKCLEGICQAIKDQLEDQRLDCTYKVADNNIFYLVVSNQPAFMESVALRMTDVSDPDSVKYEDNFVNKTRRKI